MEKIREGKMEYINWLNRLQKRTDEKVTAEDIKYLAVTGLIGAIVGSAIALL